MLNVLLFSIYQNLGSSVLHLGDKTQKFMTNHRE
jgi:hypothetical protein